MAVTYQQRRALPGKRHMRAAELRQTAGIVPNTMAALRRDEIIDDEQEREAK